MTSPIYVALDTPDLDRAKAIAEAVRNHVGGLKLGLEFFTRQRPRRACARWPHLGLPIFLDLKLHDIPNTVAKAVQALRPLEPAILTVHAAGGRAMLEDAKAAAPVGHEGGRRDRADQPRRRRSRRDRRRRQPRTIRSCG